MVHARRNGCDHGRYLHGPHLPLPQVAPEQALPGPHLGPESEDNERQCRPLDNVPQFVAAGEMVGHAARGVGGHQARHRGPDEAQA